MYLAVGSDHIARQQVAACQRHDLLHQGADVVGGAPGGGLHHAAAIGVIGAGGGEGRGRCDIADNPAQAILRVVGQGQGGRTQRAADDVDVSSLGLLTPAMVHHDKAQEVRAAH